MPVPMRFLVLALLLSSPLLAAGHGENDWRVALGGAWVVPLRSPDGFNGTRQDAGVSLLVQRESRRWLAQAEMAGSGVWAANPSFLAISGKLGLFVVRAPDIWVALGLAYVTQRADSSAECFPPFNCDKLRGSGGAVTAELGARLFPQLAVEPAVFAQLLVPRFHVEQHDYVPAIQNTNAVGVVLFGMRLFL